MGRFEEGKGTIKAVGALNTHFAKSNKARTGFKDVAQRLNVPHTFTNNYDADPRANGINDKSTDAVQRRPAVDTRTSSTASRGDSRDVKQLVTSVDAWAAVEETEAVVDATRGSTCLTKKV